MQITTIGLDIAKNVFQVHGIVAQHPKSSAIHKNARPITPSSGDNRTCKATLNRSKMTQSCRNGR